MAPKYEFFTTVEVDFEPSSEEDSEEGRHPRRGVKRVHSPSPHLTHKAVAKLEEAEAEAGIHEASNLQSLLEEAADEALGSDATELEELRKDPTDAMAEEEELSDDDDRPYKPGLYYKCPEEWRLLPHDKVLSFTTNVPGNILRYNSLQLANKDSGFSTISTLGPVFNEITINFDEIDEDTGEQLEITLRSADQLWDPTKPKSYYPVVSTGCDTDLDYDGPALSNLKRSDQLIIHSMCASYSNRHAWSVRKEQGKIQGVCVGKFSQYKYYRVCNVYLGPTVRVKGDQQLVAAMNAELKKVRCLTHYREMHQLMVSTPVQDIWDWQVGHSQDKKDHITFSIAATDCQTQVCVRAAPPIKYAVLILILVFRLRRTTICTICRQGMLSELKQQSSTLRT